MKMIAHEDIFICKIKFKQETYKRLYKVGAKWPYI